MHNRGIGKEIEWGKRMQKSDNFYDMENTLLLFYKTCIFNPYSNCSRFTTQNQGCHISLGSCIDMVCGYSACIWQSYKWVNTLGRVLCWNERILRWEYGSPHPNFCWHGNGHHKLIWWGFVIHGFLDGYCCTVRVAHNLYVHTTNLQFHYIGHWTACEYE